MVAIILPADPHVPDPANRSKVNFQNIVMLHIKLKGNMNAATWKQILRSQTRPHPR